MTGVSMVTAWPAAALRTIWAGVGGFGSERLQRHGRLRAAAGQRTERAAGKTARQGPEGNYAAASLAFPWIIVGQLLRPKRAADALPVDSIRHLLERFRKLAQVAHEPVGFGQGRFAEVLNTRPGVADHRRSDCPRPARGNDRLVEVGDRLVALAVHERVGVVRQGRDIVAAIPALCAVIRTS